MILMIKETAYSYVKIIYQLAKMIVEKITLLLPFILVLAIAGDDQLLKIGDKHSCIKQVITIFVSNKNCNGLDDSAKSQLALKMTECLLQQMGKSLPSECRRPATGSCPLEGDSWNTFSTFFTHIDNLCHFYWQMLHHERAELLIDQLSQSSHNAETLLKKNAKESQRIFLMQQTMHESLEQSLSNQQQMTKLINSSAKHISNLTLEMESFVRRIHEDISENYGSLRNILNAINDGLSQALSIQSYMTAQLSSIRGTLYFLCHFLLILFITSFKGYEVARLSCLIALATNVIIEVTAGNWIEGLIGIHRLRYLIIFVELITIWKTDNKKNELEEVISHHLNTPRLKNVFRRVIVEYNTQTCGLNCPSSHQVLQAKYLPNVKEVSNSK